MATRILSPENLGPGVRENPHGGYHIHVVLNDVSSPVLGGAINQDGLAEAWTVAVSRTGRYRRARP